MSKFERFDFVKTPFGHRKVSALLGNYMKYIDHLVEVSELTEELGYERRALTAEIRTNQMLRASLDSARFDLVEANVARDRARHELSELKRSLQGLLQPEPETCGSCGQVVEDTQD